MIDYIHKDLYWQDSIDKQLKIELEDGTILDNSMIYSEEFELEESVCSEDELRFGACEASCVKFRIFSIPNRLVGQKITISEVLGGQTDSPMQIGKYKIASAKPTADRDFIDIVAYDVMYDIIHSDVAEWYNNQFKATTSTTTDEDGNETTVVTYSTTTLKKFRDSFFSHFGIEQVDVTLPNDNMVVSKTIEIVPNEDGTIGETLSGSVVIEAICELNGCFGHINRNGKFEYVTLQPISKELFPADDLFPRNDLYPASDNTGVVIYNWQYEATEYEDFDVQPITQVQIIQEDNDIGMTVGTDGNKYVVNSNFLTYSLSDAELETVGTNLLSVIEKDKYTPIKANVIGNPCVTVGDIIKIVTNSAILYSYVINRTLKGCQSLTDEFESNGEEYRSVDVNSTSGQIKKLQGRSNVLERSIDETRSTIANVEKGLKSEIKQTAESITSEVERATSEEQKLSSKIEQTAESITSIVSSTQSKWDVSYYEEKNWEIIYGTSEQPESDPTGDNKLYLDVVSGGMYASGYVSDISKYVWQFRGYAKKTEDVLQSSITQTASSIESTVAESQSKWDITNFPVPNATIKSGYGVPKVSATGYNGYLDVSTGLEYYWGDDGTGTGNKKWAIVGIATEIKSDLETKIEQTSESITLEVNRAKEKEGELSSKIGLNAGNISLEVNRATTKEEELQSSIDMQAHEIVLKVDANGKIVEVALTGDPKDGTEFTVDADNISLTASDIIDIIANNSINLTSKNISIDSTNFSVDEDGNMSCKNASVKGDILATSLKVDEKITIKSVRAFESETYITDVIYTLSEVIGGREVSVVHAYIPNIDCNLNVNGIFSKGNVQSSNDLIAGNDLRVLNNASILGSTTTYLLYSTYAINAATTAKPNCYISTEGLISKTSTTSSKRFKDNITEDIENELDPNKLYDIKVVQFKYKKDYFKNKDDIRYRKNLIGFIAEDIYEKYPIAADFHYDDGKVVVDTWNEQYLIPPMLKLIQEQKKEIDTLKQKLATLTERMDRYEQGL